MRGVLAGLFLATVVFQAGAGEYGRGSLTASGGGMGRAPLPAPTYDGTVAGGTWGVKADVGWALVDWDIGPASGSESLFAPQASVFYKVTESVDVNLSGLFVSAEDEDGEWGDTGADMARLALGVRYWFNTQTRFVPYVGGGIGYYFLDGTLDNTRAEGQVVPVADVSADDWPGAFLEGGLAFQVADDFFINADLSYDFLLGSADATINGADEDLKMSVVFVGLGVTWMF